MDNNKEQFDKLNDIYMKKSLQWRAAFFGLLILIAGIAIGGASMMIFAPGKIMSSPPAPEFESLRMIPPLRRNLGLSREQEKKIIPLLDEHLQKLQEIRETARSEIEDTLVEMNKEISSILTPAQRARWQQELNHLQQELRADEGPRRGVGRGMGSMQRRGEGMGGRGGAGRGMRFGAENRQFPPSPPPNMPNLPQDEFEEPGPEPNVIVE